MYHLRQGTAVTVPLGPFVDSTDGYTPETGLTIAYTDVRLSVNGGEFAAKHDTNGCTHDEGGWYSCPLDSTDTANLGLLRLYVEASGALPVWHDFAVIQSNVYDSLYSTDKVQVDVVQVEGGDATDSLLAAITSDSTKIAASQLNTLSSHDPGTTIGTSTLTASQVWEYGTRSLTTFGTLVSDVATAVWSSTTRTLTSFGTLAADVWSYSTRTLTSFGTLAEDVWTYSTRSLTTFGTLASDVATAVWAAGTRTLTSFGTLTADIWGYSTRSLTTFGTLTSDVATAVWAAGTRTLTSFGTLVSDITTGVWAASTRTLTSFGTLASDTATAVWDAGTRTLTSFGTLVADVWGYSTRSLTTFGTLVSDITSSVWSTGTRTLTSFGSLANDVASAVWSSTTRTVTSLSSVAGDIWSYSTRTLTSIGDFAADVWNYTTRTVSQVTGSVGSIANGGITASSLASSATESIADAIWDEAATGHTDSGKAGAQIWTDIDAILDYTGTSGVAIADNSITAAKIAVDAINSQNISTDALAEIASAVLSKLVAEHKGTEGSLADVINNIWRRVGYGAILTDKENNTIETYDSESVTGTPILTQTMSSDEQEVTWTPS